MHTAPGRWTRACMTVLPLLGMLAPGALSQARAAATPVQYAYWATVDNPYPVPGPQRSLTMSAHFTNSGAAIQGVPMTSIWRYTGHRIFCYAATNADGIAICKRLLPGLQLGSAVEINVSFSYQGTVYSTSTSALPI